MGVSFLLVNQCAAIRGWPSPRFSLNQVENRSGLTSALTLANPITSQTTSRKGHAMTNNTTRKTLQRDSEKRGGATYTSPPDREALEAMAHHEVEEIAAVFGVDISKRWSKREMIEQIGRAHEWASKPDPDGTRA